jgi:hypothetical protein
MESLQVERAAIFERTGPLFNNNRLPHRLAIICANATLRGYCKRKKNAPVEFILPKNCAPSIYEF